LSSANAMIRRHWHLLVFILGLIFVFWLLWVLRNVLMPFVVGFIVAYLILPIIRWFERHLPGKNSKSRLKRISIILAVYVVTLAVLGLLAFYTVTLVSRALVSLTLDASQIIPNALDTISRTLKSLPILSSPSIQAQIDVYSAQAADALPGVLSNVLIRGVKVFQSSAGAVLGFIIMPVFVFFILKDWDRLRDRFYASMPYWARGHTEAIFAILQNAVVRYIRAQLILGLAVAVLSYVLLMVLKMSFALPLAVFAGVMDLVPSVGPVLGGALAVLVALATAPEKAIWVAIGYVVIQLLENQLLGPRIQGSQMEIHPAFLLMLSVIGAYFAGLLGFIIVLPLTMTVIKIFRHFRDSISSRPDNGINAEQDQVG
jgi:predicted PurR-regulated permease PerM